MWDLELAKMNENKKGKPYSFPDFFILVIGHIRTYFRLPYRQTEGIIKATERSLLPNHPSYSQICRRANKLDIDIYNSIDDDDELIIAIYSTTGIKVTNRGQWMIEKWGTQNDKKKKGYLKIHVAALDIQTKEILALEVTDEKIHDGKVMDKLVKQVLKIGNKKRKIKSVLADDGSYDSNNNFQFLEERKITSGIKVRRNSVISPHNNRTRNKEVKQQTKDFLQWKKKRKYGHRWIVVETVFSSIKRMFGEYTSAAIRYQNMVKEMTMKISLYNLFRRIAA